ncbi:Gfo/Idh/MocA family oxidoreductase [Sphingobacterium alkalisoli]|uniref:Gfo/Idh/MocA family oxidoreductase n=1 Tax=Sphingobacterium alkalisoli TaxID=1874115 RepID=A0A4U0H5M0_9SPHI|nr:Gfo/Idh/MocA family oxidoreductase [Sphingobacterium alkalisoli]TJY67041.1 Gfo/Idh/MocA family oxidoreductase [Sphingobacterium alkalisoli]GGH12608.1 glucose-fructose oxidoreductase [Sphingobacterium alkalisoli]
MSTSRRRFLQKLALSAITLPILPSYAISQTNSRTAPHTQKPVLRVALMGLGGYAQLVANSMQSCTRAKITALISGTPSKLEEWGNKYNVPKHSRYNYENFDDIKDNPEIDAVYVITPNSLHHSQVIRVAKAGKHAICEKPMAINAKQGQEMVDACAAAGVKLLIGYRMRFEPNTLEVVRMRNDGEFGNIKFFQGLAGFRIGDPNQWRLNKELAGGGSLMDIGIYAINGARYMVGEDPVWVTAQETKTDPIKFKEGVDETIQFQLGFSNGTVASCLSTYNMGFLDRFFLNGEKGFAEMRPSIGYGPIKGRTNKGELNHPHIPHQTIQMDEMAGIILDGKKPILPVDGNVGLQDIKIIEAIYRACATGERQELHLT